MFDYLISLLMGIAVGVAYALAQVRSPAPPLIALLGLLGMVAGQQAIDMAKRQFAPAAQASTSTCQRSDDCSAVSRRAD